MVCERCGGVPEKPSQPANGCAAQVCTCSMEDDSLSMLLRLLTLLSNCGLSAGAPTVLKSRARN